MAESAARSIDIDRIGEDFGPRSVYSFEDAQLATAYPITRVNADGTVEVVSRLVCGTQRALDIAGGGRTGPDGTVVWRLSENVCRLRSGILEPVSFVATPTTETRRFPRHPRAPQCTFLTVEYHIEADGDDLTVQVTSWDSDCEPAGGVPFSYRARIPVAFVVD